MTEQSKIQNRKWLGVSVIAFVFALAGAVAQATREKKHEQGINSVSQQQSEI